MGPAKMAATATTTRISHISVMFLYGNVAGSGSCCAGCVTSHGRGGRRVLWGGKGVFLRRMELYVGFECGNVVLGRKGRESGKGKNVRRVTRGQ